MEVDYINYFNEFEREYEVLKNASNDNLAISVAIIQYIERKLKEIFKWLKKYVFNILQEEIYFFKELKPRMVSKPHWRSFVTSAFFPNKTNNSVCNAAPTSPRL